MPWRKIIKRKGMMSLMASKGCDSPSGAEAYARMLPQFDNKTFTTFSKKPDQIFQSSKEYLISYSNH